MVVWVIYGYVGMWSSIIAGITGCSSGLHLHLTRPTWLDSSMEKNFNGKKIQISRDHSSRRLKIAIKKSWNDSKINSRDFASLSYN